MKVQIPYKGVKDVNKAKEASNKHKKKGIEKIKGDNIPQGYKQA